VAHASPSTPSQLTGPLLPAPPVVPTLPPREPPTPLNPLEPAAPLPLEPPVLVEPPAFDPPALMVLPESLSELHALAATSADKPITKMVRTPPSMADSSRRPNVAEI